MNLRPLKFTSPLDLSSDSNSSDTSLRLFLNSSPSTQGRSSSGSIPWAEDAIKQNELEWERIERIFYGEEELPSDPTTREEILEWMSAFPYLRISGKKLDVRALNRRLPSAVDYMEIIEADPHFGHKRSYLEYKMKEPKSGGKVQNRNLCVSNEPNKRPIRKSHLFTAKANQSNTSKLPFVDIKANSANPLRMPPILNLKLIYSPKISEEQHLNEEEILNPRKLKTVALPVIQLNNLTLGDILTTRSISAAPESKKHLSKLPHPIKRSQSRNLTKLM